MATQQTSDARLTDRELAAWRGLLKAHSQLVATLDEELEREVGLPLGSYEVLLHLADAPDGSLRMGDLADHLLLSRSGLTRLIDRLERAGLAERLPNPADRRGVLVRATEEGRRRFAAVTPGLQDFHRTQWSNLTDSEITTFRRLLGKALWGDAPS